MYSGTAALGMVSGEGAASTGSRQPPRPRAWQAPVAFCGCPMATLIPATFMGRVVTPGEETTAAGTDTTGGFARAT